MEGELIFFFFFFLLVSFWAELTFPPREIMQKTMASPKKS